MNILSEDQTEYLNCDICVVSGSLIQVPKIDENGDIEIYVSKNSYTYNIYNNFYSPQISGGATRKTRSFYEYINGIFVKTPAFETNGITLKGLTAGRYKVVQTG